MSSKLLNYPSRIIVLSIFLLAPSSDIPRTYPTTDGLRLKLVCRNGVLLHAAGKDRASNMIDETEKPEDLFYIPYKTSRYD